MSARSARRPLPALIFLIALAVLASIVWYRVDHRSQAEAASTPKPTPCATATTTVLPANSAVTVNVVNANGTNGLARSTLDAFTALGFVAGTTTTADQNSTDVATVTSGPTAAAAAKLVSFYVPGSTVAADGRTDATVTVTVGSKFTGVATAGVAKAALAAAKVTQAAAGAPPAASSPSC